MTAFFLAGSDADIGQAEVAYNELRERSRVAFGGAAKPVRIFKIECRLDGHDCEVEVGRPLPGGNGVVVAILDHGRQGSFAVYTDGDDGVVYVPHPAYSVTAFS